MKTWALISVKKSAAGTGKSTWQQEGRASGRRIFFFCMALILSGLLPEGAIHIDAGSQYSFGGHSFCGGLTLKSVMTHTYTHNLYVYICM